MKFVKSSSFLILAVALAMLVGLGAKMHPGAPAHSQNASGKILVTADFYPMAEFARQVGGEHVRVNTLVKAGMDAWASRVLPDLRQVGVTVVQASQGIPLLAATSLEQAATAANTDPHVWLDPMLAAREVDNIAAGLSTADPAHRLDYAANAAAYKARLDRLDVDFRKGLASCASRDIVTSHAAFQYLARRYGLNQVAISGLSPDEEPSPHKLADIARFARTHHVRTIFFETLVSPRLPRPSPARWVRKRWC